MIIVLCFVNLANTSLSLEALIHTEVDCKSWSISDEHPLVSFEETSHTFGSIYPRDLLWVAHALFSITLCSYFQEIEYKRNIGECKASTSSWQKISLPYFEVIIRFKLSSWPRHRGEKTKWEGTETQTENWTYVAVIGDLPTIGLTTPFIKPLTCKHQLNKW